MGGQRKAVAKKSYAMSEPEPLLYMNQIVRKVRGSMEPGRVYLLLFKRRSGNHGRTIFVKREMEMVADCGSFVLFRKKNGSVTCILYQDLYFMLSQGCVVPTERMASDADVPV